jgi:serine phosphatase RsbU (regulator of sigma subunit)/tetratricopeptide (TPR) repeat protein
VVNIILMKQIVRYQIKYKRKILFLFFLFINSTVFTQTKLIDSLKQLLAVHKIDTVYVKILGSLCNEYNNAGEYKKAISTCHNCIKLANGIGYKKGIADALGNLGVSYHYIGLMDSAFFFHNSALAIRQKINDQTGIGIAYTNLALVEMARGNFSDSKKLFDKSIKISEQTKNRHGMANALFNLGIVYYYEGNFPQTLNCCLNALKIYGEIKDNPGIIVCNNGIAVIYAEQKNYSKAMEFFQKNLLLCRQLKDRSGESGALSNIGGIYLAWHQLDKSLEMHLQALALVQEINSGQSLASEFKNIADLYVLKKNPDTALIYAGKGLNIAEEIKSSDLIAGLYASISKAHLLKKEFDSALTFAKKSEEISKESSLLHKKNIEEILSDIYQGLGRNDLALLHFKEHIRLKDSVYNDEKNKELIQKQMNFDFEKQISAQKAEYDKEQLQNIAKQNQQRVIIISVITGFIFLGIFSFFLYKRFRLTNLQKQIIEDQKKEVELKSQQLELANKEVIDSITYAKRLQEAILPPVKMITNVFSENFILFKPKAIVAGDFYWMETINNVAFIAVADCTGHGVPGAMVSVVCSNALTRTVKEFKISNPAEILFKVRELVIETFEKSESEVKDGMDISLISILKADSGELPKIQWAGANNPLLYSEGGILKTLMADKQPIGKADHLKPFTSHNLELKKGDCIYLITDGFADQFGGPNGKKLKLKYLKELLQENLSKSMDEQMEICNNIFKNWKSKHEQVDDVTIIGVKI